MADAHVPTIIQAWHVTRYGGPEVLALRDVPVPRPGKGDVLVRVQATTVSSGDRRIRSLDLPPGMTTLGRLALGWSRPRQPILGTEFTGIVAAVGAGVTRFRPGEPVIAFTGLRQGAHGAYALVSERAAIVPRPPALGIADAAALGFGGLTAMDYLRRAGLRPGEEVLVVGASGTVGAALVRLAQLGGASVTAVTSAANADMARQLGAAATIDYAAEDMKAGRERWDIVADAVGALSFRTACPMLRDGGRYLAIASGLGDLLVRRRAGRRCIAGPAAERPEDLAALAHLAARGLVRPPVEAVYPFEALPAAHARADTGRKRGSLVVTLDDEACPPTVRQDG